MDRNGLLALYDYNLYANRLMLDVAERLTEDELVRESSPSHGSVRALLHHILNCEVYFLATCRGDTDLKFNSSEIPGLDDMRRYWDKLGTEQRDYISSLGENDFIREVSLTLRGHPYHLSIWQLMTQAFVHSTHHRGELSIVLTELGHPLPTLDIILYFLQHSGQQWLE
jgi:uncharacterized damage-inducible protein DinB